MAASKTRTYRNGKLAGFERKSNNRRGKKKRKGRGWYRGLEMPVCCPELVRTSRNSSEEEETG
jgi:hypothetical protein